MSTDAPSDADSEASAPRDEELAALIKEVDEDDGQGASGMSDRLRDRTEQSAAEPEAPGDLED